MIGTIAVITAVIVFWPVQGLPRTFRQRVAVATVVRSDYQDKGLWPPTTEEFFSSVLGKAAYVLHQDPPLRGNLGGLTLSHHTEGNSIAVRISFNQPSYDGEENGFSVVERLSSSETEQTLRLLSAASRGTKWWRHTLVGWRDYYERAFPGAKVVEPDIAFDLPSTNDQLTDYWRWLARVTGSTNRFRDGWGNPIELTLVHSEDCPARLIARSMGQDGRWNTHDDIVIARDVETGNVVEQMASPRQ